MDFFQLIRDRRSIRNFLEQPVEEEKIRAILESANSAPSAGDLQSYEIYVAAESHSLARLASAIPQMEFFASAPLILVFCSNPERSAARHGERGRRLFSIQDATIACTHAMLAAAALGLGCVWVGAFDEAEVVRALDIPQSQIPVAILPIGYPAETAEARPRRPLEDIVHNVR